MTSSLTKMRSLGRLAVLTFRWTTLLLAWAAGVLVAALTVNLWIRSNRNHNEQFWAYKNHDIWYLKTYPTGVLGTLYVNSTDRSALEFNRVENGVIEKGKEGLQPIVAKNPPRADYFKPEESNGVDFCHDFAGAGIISFTPPPRVVPVAYSGNRWTVTITLRYVTWIVMDGIFLVLLFFQKRLRHFVVILVSGIKAKIVSKFVSRQTNSHSGWPTPVGAK